MGRTLRGGLASMLISSGVVSRQWLLTESLLSLYDLPFKTIVVDFQRFKFMKFSGTVRGRFLNHGTAFKLRTDEPFKFFKYLVWQNDFQRRGRETNLCLKLWWEMNVQPMAPRLRTQTPPDKNADETTDWPCLWTSRWMWSRWGRILSVSGRCRV